MKSSQILSKLILLGSILLIGCSSNDNELPATDSNQDQFVGAWKPIKFVSICAAETNYEEIYSACEQNGVLTVKSDGTYSQSSYYDNGSVCEEDIVVTGTW